MKFKLIIVVLASFLLVLSLPANTQAYVSDRNSTALPPSYFGAIGVCAGDIAICTQYLRTINNSLIGNHDASQDEWYWDRMFLEFNTSSIPDTTNIHNVTLNLTTSSSQILSGAGCFGFNPVTANITRLNNTQPSNATTYPDTTAGNTALWNNISNGYNNIGSYAGLLNYTVAGTNYSAYLGTTSYTDLKNLLNKDFFPLGMKSDVEIEAECNNNINFNANKIYLSVTHGCNPPIYGNWILNKTCVITDEYTPVYGNFTCQDSCNLIVNGTTIVNFTISKSNIKIMSGGKIKIQNTSKFMLR